MGWLQPWSSVILAVRSSSGQRRPPSRCLKGWKSLESPTAFHPGPNEVGEGRSLAPPPPVSAPGSNAMCRGSHVGKGWLQGRGRTAEQMGKGSSASEHGQGCGPRREAWEDQARCHIRGLPGTEDLLTLPCGPSKDMSTTSRDLIMSVKLWCIGRLFPRSQGTPLFQCMGTHIRVPRHGHPGMMEGRQD